MLSDGCKIAWDVNNSSIYFDIVSDYCTMKPFNTKCIDYYSKLKTQKSSFIGGNYAYNNSYTFWVLLLVVLAFVVTFFAKIVYKIDTTRTAINNKNKNV